MSSSAELTVHDTALTSEFVWSVLDVERVTQCAVKPDPLFEVQVTYWLAIEYGFGNGQYVVAVDDAGFG